MAKHINKANQTNLFFVTSKGYLISIGLGSYTFLKTNKGTFALKEYSAD